MWFYKGHCVTYEFLKHQPFHVPVMHHRQAVVFFKQPYWTQYSPSFVHCSPLVVNNEGDGAETPLFSPIYVCLLKVKREKSVHFCLLVFGAETACGCHTGAADILCYLEQFKNYIV